MVAEIHFEQAEFRVAKAHAMARDPKDHPPYPLVLTIERFPPPKAAEN
jgi:hypothetical protein